MSQLESCDPGNDDLLLATVWLLLASSLLGNCWENSDAVTMVKYVEKCIGKTDKLAQVVAMVSCIVLLTIVHITVATVTEIT